MIVNDGKCSAASDLLYLAMARSILFIEFSSEIEFGAQRHKDVKTFGLF